MLTAAEKLRQLENVATPAYSFQYLLLVSAGDYAFLKEIATMYLDAMVNYAADCRQIAANKDLEALKQQTHKIATSFNSLGMDYLQPCFDQIKHTGAWDNATYNSLTMLITAAEDNVPLVRKELDL
ncbi:hypothetical protein [Chitinophaga varians]|uniref:hypothetical protein n=1 Tax=Chitinophaga varians TaxID=2202339 RepID=UPI00165FB1E3|nr:hypothetical protein [Chitinophaga varians]MBC9912054.1 hypothetical protein [Chitinophaga varians]